MSWLFGPDEQAGTHSGGRAAVHEGRRSLFAYAGAAVAEIAGCFSFWAWLRLDKSIWWLVPGGVSLTLFAYLLTLVDSDAAGRAYAAYGGVYIVASRLWLWAVKGVRPDHWASRAPQSASLGQPSSC